MHCLTPAFILQNLAQGQDQGRFAAVALFVDTSGFTPLTLALMAHGAEGAEMIAQVLANLFTPLIDVVYRHGGFVAGFAGDAFKAIFPGQTPETYQRALTAAWQIRQQLAQQPTQPTRFGDFPFVVKVTVADGTIDWCIWQSADTGSGSAQQAAALFGGAALGQALAADPFARAGEVLLTATVAARLPIDSVLLEPVATYFRLCSWPETTDASPPVRADVPLAAPIAALASRFFPADLLERQTQGEFRQVVTVFINVQRLPADQEATAFVAALFRLLAQYGGYLCRVGQIGDKDQGATLLLFWGAPTSHEQDVTRALHFVLALQSAASTRLRVGITTQLAYAGFVGAPQREEYTCYGPHVNLAARQMVMAGWDELWLDEETTRLASATIVCAHQGIFHFKGFAEAKAVYRLLGQRESGGGPFYQGALVGRQAELAQLTAALAPLQEGKFAGVLTISGEAGIGKSRLVHELQNWTRINADERGSQELICAHPRLSASNIQWFLCQTDEILRQPLNPLRYWLRSYFNQSTSANEAANKAAFTAKLDELLAYLQTLTTDLPLATELARTRSFLGALVDLHWPDSLYAQVEPQLRFENTLAALKTLILAESLRQPVILHVEDSHWLDEASHTLLTRLTHNVAPYPFAIVVTSRPSEERGSAEAKAPLPGPAEQQEDATQASGATEWLAPGTPQVMIRLTTLTTTEIAGLARTLLGGSVAPELVALVQARAEGNPFFTEQLLRYCQEQALLEPGATGWQVHADQTDATLLPNGVRALLVARLDRLPQPVKEVVQTAAVLGREFDTQVLAQMLAHDTTLTATLAVADRAAIWSAMTEVRYLFRHALLRAAAYDMQLRARLRTLHHQAAAALEQRYRADLTPYLGELAYHYDQAEVIAQAVHWYGQAGEQASKQYVNETAARYFRRALALTPAPDAATRYSLLLGSEAAHNWLGRRQPQQEDLATLAAVTALLNDNAKRSEVLLRKTAFHLATGRYQEASGYAEQAVAFAVQAGDALAEANAYHRWGRACWQAGDYKRARPHLVRALQLARSNQMVMAEAQSLYDLGMIDYYEKAIASALAMVKQAAQLFESVQDERGRIYCLSLSAVILREMGDYGEATAQFETALQGCRQIGLRYAEARLLAQSGDNALNLGALTAAYQQHTQALKLFQEINDQEGCATSLDTVGLLLTFLERPAEAQKHYHEALTLHRAMNDPRGESYVLTHLGHLLVQQQEWQQAAVILEQALALRRGRAEEGLWLDTLAASVMILVGRTQASAALPQVDEMLAWLAAHGVAGVEFPGQVYLCCYRVLNALAQTDPIYQQRAVQTLAAGYIFLQERAARIPDTTLRQSFLQNIPFHREIVALWQIQDRETRRAIPFSVFCAY